MKNSFRLMLIFLAFSTLVFIGGKYFYVGIGGLSVWCVDVWIAVIKWMKI